MTKIKLSPPVRMAETKNIEKAEWLEHRRKGISGTDTACIFGMNPYKTAYQCYQDKLGLLPEVEDNNRMRMGRDMEDVVAKWFSEETGLSVQNRYAIFKSSEYPWMIANIDRWIVGQRSILECKTAMYMFQKEQWGESGTDKVPDQYLFQIYHYMIVFGVEKAQLAVVFTDTKELRIYNFKLNHDLAIHIVEKTKEFWNKVENKIEPELTNMDDILIKHPVDNGQAIVATDEQLNNCLKHEELRQKIKILETEMDGIKLDIAQSMTDNVNLLVDSSGKIISSFSTMRPRITIDTKKLKERYPDAYDNVNKLSNPKRSIKMKWQTLSKLLKEE